MLRDKARSSLLPIGIETDLLTNAALDLRGFKRGADGLGTHPTTGFHAVLAFALECGRLDLYGFKGELTADGHLMSADHGIEREHAILDKLSRREQVANMPQWLRRRWASTRVNVVC